MIANIIQTGCKVDLCMMQQIEQERKTGVRAHIYKSQVTNIFADGGLELSMPMESGKLVLLPIGTRFEFVFYAQDGLYKGTGLVEERYKTNNIYLLRVSLKSPLRKFQRREYSRMACVIRGRWSGGLCLYRILNNPENRGCLVLSGGGGCVLSASWKIKTTGMC